MSTYNYGPITATALRLIKKFGEKATFTRETSAPETDEPWNGSEPIVETQILDAVFLKYKTEDIDGAIIRTSDQKVLVSAVGVTFELDQRVKLTRDGQDFVIISSAILNPGGTRLIYTLQVRQ